MKRRNFIQSGALTLSGLLLARSAKSGIFSYKKKAPPVGLQLYTLGDLMTTDPQGTLQKLAAIGYKELESAGSQKGNFYGYKPKELSMHFHLARFKILHDYTLPASNSKLPQMQKAPLCEAFDA